MFKQQVTKERQDNQTVKPRQDNEKDLTTPDTHKAHARQEKQRHAQTK